MGNCLGKKSIEHKNHLTKRSPSRLVQTTYRLSSTIDDVKQSFVILNPDECQIDIVDEQLNSSLSEIDEKFVLTPSFNSQDWKSTLHDVDTIKADETLQESIESIGEISEIGFDKSVLINENDDDEKLQTDSSTPSLSNSPCSSSFSPGTTPFSSIEHLILSSSSDDVPCSLSPSVDRNRCQSLLNYSEQISINPSSSTFPFLLPVKLSHQSDNSFFHQFHQRLLCHRCQILRSIIDDIVEQENIRIHHRSQTILIEHKQMFCVDLETSSNDRSSWFFFDSIENSVRLRKYAPQEELQPIVEQTNSSTIISNSKLFDLLRPFLLVNVTHHFIQQYLIQSNQKDLFGYISSRHSNRIEQMLINKSKLNYSKNVDVEKTSFEFVLRLSSWPNEIRTSYEQRSRHWPTDIADLFTESCFIHLNDSTHCWSFSYASIEARLVSMMSIEQRRFASILWNYLNGKSQGTMSYRAFKHSLFYFFEEYSFNDFSICDSHRFIDLFLQSFVGHCQNDSCPHYFNTNETISVDFHSMIELFSRKSTTKSFDLKKFSICHRSNSSSYLYHLIYLIEFQSRLLESLLSSKCNPIQTTLVNLDQSVKKQFSSSSSSSYSQLFQRKNDSCSNSLTLDDLYRYQDENVHMIFNYLSLLRRREPSILVHSFWSMFIQYLNSFFDDLFLND